MVESDGARLQMTASYLDDALGDLLNALVTLANGGTSAMCLWTQEPGGWRWSFYRPNETKVEVTIGFREDVLAVPWGPPETDEPRFHTCMPLVELVQAVVDGSQRCLDAFGAEGFARQWIESPFPALQVESLKRWLDRGEVAPRYEKE